jgi:hypothetical protein
MSCSIIPKTHQMKNTKAILTVLLSLQLLVIKSQQEFFVTVNSITGVHTIIDSVPGVNYISGGLTSYDKNNHRYIFHGKDFSGQNHLYCLDAITGSIISAPNCTLNLAEFKYDNSTNTLYALELNNSLGKMYLVSLNITTAISSIIDTLPFTGVANGTTFFDENHHNYVIQNGTSLYFVNANTGNITSTPVTASFNETCFDNVTGFAYALILGPSMTLAKINISNGTYSTVCTFTVSGYNSTQTSFNEINHNYTFSSTNHLYSVSVNTGSIISDPTFPVGITSPQNVIELHYDNSNGNLYALHWGARTETGITGISNITERTGDDFRIMPNPVSANTVIYLSRQFEEINICMFNAFGQMLNKSIYQNTQFAHVQLDYLPKGIYFISVQGDNKYLGIKKIIVE